MLSLFKGTPLLDESTEQWLIDAFIWAYTEFDGQATLRSSKIILPTKAFFPKAVNSTHDMAEHVFEQVVGFSQMQAWPLRLVLPQQLAQQQMPRMTFANTKRGEEAHLVESTGMIDVSYNPQQVNQPQDLVASFAQTLAYIQVLNNPNLPPGGKEYVAPAVEVLASMMGFNLMMANTAYQFKGGCGSCYNPYANRNAALGEPELIYLLAMMTVIKGDSEKEIKRHLKPHLKGLYKKALKQFQKTKENAVNPMLLALTEKQ